MEDGNALSERERRERLGIRVQAQLSFSVRGPDVDPDEVARVLGLPLAPERHRRGDPFERDGQTFPYLDGFCAFISNSSIPLEENFEEHATWLLDRLEPHAATIAKWQANGWYARLTALTVAEGTSGGPIVSAALMMRLAKLAVPIRWLTMSSPQSFPPRKQT